MSIVLGISDVNECTTRKAEFVEPRVVVSLNLCGIDAGDYASIELEGLGMGAQCAGEKNEGEENAVHGLQGKSRQFSTSPWALVKTARMWLFSCAHSDGQTMV